MSEAGAEARRRRLERVRWHCRRGLLELDLLLGRFIAGHLEALSDEELGVLEGLLAQPDNDLWDQLSGRAAPAAGEGARMLTRISAG